MTAGLKINVGGSGSVYFKGLDQIMLEGLFKTIIKYDSRFEHGTFRVRSNGANY